MQATLGAPWYTYVGMHVLLSVALMTRAPVGGCTVSIQTAARTSWNTPAMSNQCQSGMLTSENTDYEIYISRDMVYEGYCLLGFDAM
jgi:hypothetical protein